MLARIVEVRVTLALIVAAVVGTWGLHAYPMRSDDVFLALVEARKPFVVTIQGAVQVSPIGVPCEACRGPSDRNATAPRSA